MLKLPAAALIATIAIVQAQTPPAPPAPARRVAAPRPPAYPQRPQAEQAVLDRGKALYGVHCNFCHGSDARGGEGGPNLLRSELVLNDVNGEKIGPVIRNGREGMPKFDLNPAQISDISAFIHNFKVGGYDASRMVPLSIVVGEAAPGEAYFKKTCAGCHSVTGDLKGIGGRITDAKVLQQTWIMPGSSRGGQGRVSPVTVTVTPASGPKVEGRLVRIDDFLVTLTTADGDTRTITRNGDVPKVVINDPLKPHKDLLAGYTDTDIHNVTAYLVTVK